MALNTQQERTLGLLKKLTPATVSKRALRSVSLLSTAEENIDYKLFPDEWRDWCAGWAFAVRPEFADALDIKLTERIVKRKKNLVWTQGYSFDFHAGYTIYDINPYPQEIWQDFLQRVSYAVTVVDARPAEPARAPSKLGPGISRDSGSVTFDVYAPNDEKTQAIKVATHIVTQDEFVQILIKGLPNDVQSP